MDERQIGLALSLQEVGVSADVSGFDSRLILQKTVYLLEEAGIRLGYSFAWYIRGPYSPGLTRDLYELASNKEDVAGWVLDSRSKVVAEGLRPLFAAATTAESATAAKHLELLASVHYLASRRSLNVNDAEQATSQLAQKGKYFSKDEVSGAIRGLKKVNLL